MNIQNIYRKTGLVVLLALILVGAPAAVFGQDVPGDPGVLINDVSGIYKLMDNLIKTFFWLLMFLAVIFVLYAAFKYLTAGGSPENVEVAQRMIMYAVIAIVIAVLARSVPWIVTSFTKGAVTGNGVPPGGSGGDSSCPEPWFGCP